MKRFAKLTAVLSALLLALALFGACSDDDDDDDDDKKPSHSTEVVAKWEDEENGKTIFFYEDDTFKVVTNKDGKTVAAGTYSGDAGEGNPGEVTLTVTSGDKNVSLAGFKIVEGDTDDDIFTWVTSPEQLLGTWKVVFENSESFENYYKFDDGTQVPYMHLFKAYEIGEAKYAKSGSSYTETFIAKSGSYISTTFKFNTALTDTQIESIKADETENFNESIEECEKGKYVIYFNVSSDKKTVESIERYTGDVTYPSNEVKVKDGRAYTVKIYDFENEKLKLEEYKYFKINSKKNKIQCFSEALQYEDDVLKEEVLYYDETLTKK